MYCIYYPSIAGSFWYVVIYFLTPPSCKENRRIIFHLVTYEWVVVAAVFENPGKCLGYHN